MNFSELISLLLQICLILRWTTRRIQLKLNSLCFSLSLSLHIYSYGELTVKFSSVAERRWSTRFHKHRWLQFKLCDTKRWRRIQNDGHSIVLLRLRPSTLFFFFFFFSKKQTWLFSWHIFLGTALYFWCQIFFVVVVFWF